MIKGTGHIIINENEVKRILIPKDDENLPGFLMINKNGITSMAEALRSRHPMEAYFKENYPQGREVVAMWREPYDRIESSYTFLSTSTGLEETFEEFIVRNCTKKGHDPHQLPQFEVASDKYGRFVPDRIIRWDWNELASVYGLSTMPYKNKTKTPRWLFWTPKLREMYRDRYAMDFVVWGGIDVLRLKQRRVEERRDPVRKRL